MIATVILADTGAYLRHPHATTVRVMRERTLGNAVAVTVLAVVLTALSFGVTPAPSDPARVTRFLALGLTWADRHRVAMTALLTVALLAVTVLGYAGTMMLVRRWRPPGTSTDWRRLLVGIGYINCVSALSALAPIPAAILENAGIAAWRALNAITLPLSMVLGAYVAVPAWHAVRLAGGLDRARSAAALIAPVTVAVSLVGGVVIAGFYLAFG